MHQSVEKLSLLKNKVNEIIFEKKLKNLPQIIVVTKKFSLDNITSLLKSGHLHYGENKVQEAEAKWLQVKKNYKDIKLHMIGKLQTNKVKKAVMIFDYIHSLDNEKLALKISQIQKELNKKCKIFIQVNIGNEDQKSGILVNDLKTFYNYCSADLSLDIIGLMCLPPASPNPEKYFQLLQKLSKDVNLNNLSMGMSADYKYAIENGSTFLRLGTAVLGERDIN